MKQHRLLALIALGTLAACGNHDAPEADADKAIAAATATPPAAKNPHIRAVDIGHTLDSAQRITGGVSTSFHPGDTIFVSLRTDYVAEGADLSARVVTGKVTMDSIGKKSPAANAEGQATVSIVFAPPKKGWPMGAHRVEAFLDGTSQGLTAIEIIR